MRNGYLGAAACSAFLLLGACGGGGGSHPNPVPPPPTIASAFPVTKSGSFDTITANRSYTVPNGTIAMDRMGVSGRSPAMTFSYDAATGSYTVHDASASATFTAADRTSTAGNIDAYAKQTTSAFYDELKLYNNVRSGTSQAGSAVQLTYLSFGAWKHNDNTALDKLNTTYFLVGYPTAVSDMPKTGSASYTTTVTGNLVNIAIGAPESEVGGTATFTANFGTGAVNTDLSLNVVATQTSLGTFLGTGTISANEFTGTFTSPNNYFENGFFAGGFYGPAAKEMGYTFAIQRGAWDPYAGATAAPFMSWIVGSVVGKKN